jgi:outer membrane protein TolC
MTEWRGRGISPGMTESRSPKSEVRSPKSFVVAVAWRLARGVRWRAFAGCLSDFGLRTSEFRFWRGRTFTRLTLLTCLTLAVTSLAAPPSTPAPRSPALSPFSTPLSLADAVNLALRQSPAVLRAKKDLEAAQGVSIQSRAIAIPKLDLSGGYNAVEGGDANVLRFPSSLAGSPAGSNNPSAFPSSFGNDQNWSTQLRIVQSIYEGGRILSSLRSARLVREQALFGYQTAVADTVLNVQIAYADVLLAEQQIVVQEASVDLLKRELADTQRRFDAGTVPRFNVLRAEVELANARPRLIRARNGLRTAKNNLANLLGVDVPKEALEDIPLKLSGKLEAVPYPIELRRALALALERRSELGALRKAEALRKEELVTAKAGYKPSLETYAGYDAHNSPFSSDLTAEKHGWIAGVQLNWNLFDGLRTQGKVREATALGAKAGIDLDDAGRRIELEVRTSFSTFIEADEVLKSQEKVVEEAEESLRLATARAEAGTGTQLDVLGAQTALTEARTTQIQALHDYAVARARLERAVGQGAEGNRQKSESRGP